jgi:hypothetical protein
MISARILVNSPITGRHCKPGASGLDLLLDSLWLLSHHLEPAYVTN